MDKMTTVQILSAFSPFILALIASTCFVLYQQKRRKKTDEELSKYLQKKHPIKYDYYED